MLNAGNLPGVGGGRGAEPIGAGGRNDDGGGGGGDDNADDEAPLPVFTAAPRVFRSDGIPLANSPPN